MRDHSRNSVRHDAEIASRQVEEMLRAASGRLPVLSENDFRQQRRLRFYRFSVKLTAGALLALFVCAVLKEFFF